MIQIFTTYIYQPFFNILVGIYWVIGQIAPGQADMGVAVIVFSLIVRIILLPLDFVGNRSNDDKKKIADQIKVLERELRHDPAKLRAAKKKLMRSNPGAIISEVFNMGIQLIIILMLYRIFKTGLEGADLHLLYSFMPPIETPINLMFLGKYDLSQTNFTLNLIQSFLIFVVEALHMLFSPLPVSRKEFISLGIFLPIVSFLIFMTLPAGKKIFIITSLLFSVFLNLIKQATYLVGTLSATPSKEPASS